jgi:hypothetical protein
MANVQLTPQSTLVPAVVPAPTTVAAQGVSWGVSPLFDYSTGHLIFNDQNEMVLGNEATSLSQRIIAMMTTNRLQWVMYTSRFGSEFHTLLGMAYPPQIARSLIETYLRACIDDNRITSVKDITVSVVGKIAVASFTVVTLQGFEKQFQGKWSV